MADLSRLTDTGQKEYSRLIKLINIQKSIIKKSEIASKECPSDKLKRAREGYIHNKKQLEEHDVIVEGRIERAIRKIREESVLDRQLKEKYLRDSEEKLEVLESEKSKSQVNAEYELEKLQGELDRVLRTVGASTQPPLTQSTETDLSSWAGVQKEEERLALLRAGRPLTVTSYALPVNNTEYGLVSDLSKKKQVKTTLKNKTDGNLLLQEQRTPSEAD